MGLPGGEERVEEDISSGWSTRELASNRGTRTPRQAKKALSGASILAFSGSLPSRHQKLSTGLEVRKFRSAPRLPLLGKSV